jgi:hypothetical protein
MFDEEIIINPFISSSEIGLLKTTLIVVLPLQVLEMLDEIFQ